MSLEKRRDRNEEAIVIFPAGEVVVGERHFSIGEPTGSEMVSFEMALGGSESLTLRRARPEEISYAKDYLGTNIVRPSAGCFAALLSADMRQRLSRIGAFQIGNFVPDRMSQRESSVNHPKNNI